MVIPRARGKLFTGLLLGGSSLVLATQATAQTAESPSLGAVGAFDVSNPNLAQWSLINLQSADAAAAADGAGVKVAVLDGKADCGNSALSGRCVFTPLSGGTYSGANFHGTHVSGIVGGNPFGVAPAATILSYGVFADAGYVATGTKLSDTWKAAYGAGAQISSMSFSCVRKALCLTSYELSTVASSSLPMLFVKAAGNDGSDLLTEVTDASSAIATAALNKTLIVGSVGASGVISGYSNRPGSGCLLAQGISACPSDVLWRNHFLVAPGESIYSTLPNESFGYMSGTSMATPVVAGVAALLQARWPFLKNAPETLAKILLTSATDLGDPGVDPVYGYGLLNANAAFLASGSVTIVAPAPTSPTTGTTTTTTTTTATATKGTTKQPKGGGPRKSSVSGGGFNRLGTVLGGVTVFDQFGRDFRWDETGTLTVRGEVNSHQMPSLRLLGGLSQPNWVTTLFSSEPVSRSFASSGSVTDIPGGVSQATQAVRIGVDVPLGKAAVQFRLTGATNPRSDLAADPSLRPLAFFPSMNLAGRSTISNVVLPIESRSKLMVYGLASTGGLDQATEDFGQFSHSGQIKTLLQTTRAHRVDEGRGGVAGLGAGFWHQTGRGLVVGVNVSAMRQTKAFYDTTINLVGFDQPTHLINAGGAVSKALGRWTLTTSGEVTHLRSGTSGQAIAFTPTTLVSGEVAVSRSGLLFRTGRTSDQFTLSFSLSPRAVAGDLQLNYMSPTADGMQIAATNQHISISELGHQPARFEAAYRVSSLSGSASSLALSGGVDVERSVARPRAAEGLITFRTAL